MQVQWHDEKPRTMSLAHVGRLPIYSHLYSAEQGCSARVLTGGLPPHSSIAARRAAPLASSHVGPIPVAELPAHSAYVQHERGWPPEGDVRPDGDQGYRPPHLQHPVQEVRYRPEQACWRAHDG